MAKRLYIVFVLIVLVSLGQAQVRKIKILSIAVEGNKTAEASSIRLNSGLMAGKEITGEDIQKAIKNLWSLRIFSDVKIIAANQTDEGIELIIRVEEFPRLKKIEMSGNDEIDTDDIEKEISVYKGMTVSDYKIFKIKKTIKKLYADEGYLLAEINIDTTSAGPDLVNLKIDIDEGEEVQVEQIRFHGNIAFEDDDLKDEMDEIQEDSWWRSADFNPKQYEKDLELVLQFCRENGYRDAEILRDSISFSEDKQDMYIDIWIYEGDKYYFGSISFTGNTIFNEDELEETLDIKRGDNYDQKKYDEGIRDRLQKMYYNQGYLFAGIQPQEIPVGKDTLNVNFNITEGHVVTVKEINISGNTRTHEKVLRREFKLHPGDVFNSARLERSIRDLTILNYFSNVVPDVQLIPDDDKHVNLEVRVEEKSTDMANMSAGYSQRDGMIGSIGTSFTNFSLAHPFSGGDGQRLTFDWQFGQIYRSISISFTEPWMFNTPTLAGFSIFDTRYGGSYLPYNSHRLGGSIHIGRRFYWPDNFFRGDWIFSMSKSSYTDIDEELLVDYGYRGYNNIKQVSLTQIISRDSRDQPEFPTRGSVHSFSLQLSGGPLGGDAQYIKSIFSAEWFIPLYYGFILYSHNKYGFLEQISNNSTVLFNEFFYIGGSGLSYAESLRGYGDGQAGPLSSTGQAIGGQAMVKNSVELRFPISPNPTIFGLFFAEAGNAWKDITETDPFNLKRSAGVGIRLFMPMLGIIGIDLGYGYDRLNTQGEREGQWEVHFKFGKF